MMIRCVAIWGKFDAMHAKKQRIHGNKKARDVQGLRAQGSEQTVSSDEARY